QRRVTVFRIPVERVTRSPEKDDTDKRQYSLIEDGEVIGIAMSGPVANAQPEVRHLYVLYLLDGHHGSGAGSALLDAVIAPTDIINHTAEYFKLSVDDLYGSSRSQAIATARQIAMYLCREMTSLSLPKIGQLFGSFVFNPVKHPVPCTATARRVSRRTPAPAARS
ncbi:GNAT family N-acetyltransferase, partial [Bacillus sp. S34]|nr:GNAT family N-acetyltransferase [Bacillus sp. S34]